MDNYIRPDRSAAKGTGGGEGSRPERISTALLTYLVPCRFFSALAESECKEKKRKEKKAKKEREEEEWILRLNDRLIVSEPSRSDHSANNNCRIAEFRAQLDSTNVQFLFNIAIFNRGYTSMRVVRKRLAITKELACSFSRSVAFSIPENTPCCPVVQPRGSAKQKYERKARNQYFLAGLSVRGSCDPFSNLFPFACSLFSSADRQAGFPGNPFEEERRGERERRRTVSRAQERKIRGQRERTTDETPRCLPFIKLLLNAAFLRTHN